MCYSTVIPDQHLLDEKYLYAYILSYEEHKGGVKNIFSKIIESAIMNPIVLDPRLNSPKNYNVGECCNYKRIITLEMQLRMCEVTL